MPTVKKGKKLEGKSQNPTLGTMLEEAAPGVIGRLILWYVHLFVQPICGEKLLGGRHCSGRWGYSAE